MVLQRNRLQTFFAAALALAAGASSSMFASALEWTVADCAGLAALPTGEMTEDVNLFLDDAIEFTCNEVTTVIVDGNYKYRVTSDNFNVKFSNVRFEIRNYAEFSFSLAVGEDLGIATFEGITRQDADGGVFYVESGSNATFEVPMAFEGNTVNAGYDGGAVFVGGTVTFDYRVDFTKNDVLSFEDDFAGNGGAIAVGSEGMVSFNDFSYFTSNSAQSGGYGGAIANSGSVVFKRASYFYSNLAREDGDELGGAGGAIYTGGGSITVFERRTIMHLNMAASGGAVFNEGTMTLESAGFFRGNEARGIDRARGGHICTAGPITIALKVNFREGSGNEGGAIFIDTGGSVTTGDEVNYTGNTALEQCPDVFARGKSPVCQP